MFNKITYIKNKGFTLVEMIIASTIVLLMSAVIFSLIGLVAREQRIGLIEQRLNEHADRIQDFIELTMQAQSKEAGVSYPNLVNGFSTKIAFREGIGFPNQQLSYDANAKNLIYDSDVSLANNERIVGFEEQADGLTHLDAVRFWPGMQVGGIPDGSFVNVWVEVSDHGLIEKTKQTGRIYKKESDIRNPNNPIYWVKVVRTFTVGLRQN